jgi:hypothetical protein
MRRSFLIFMGFAIFVAGAASGLLWSTHIEHRVNTEWQTVLVPEKTKGISYSTQAIFSGIPSPNVNRLTGAVKFVEGAGADSNESRIGYKIAADVAPLDLSKTDTKYLRSREVVVDGRTLTMEPIKQVTYEVRFVFSLLDKDGFELLKVQSEPENLESGKINDFQAIASQPLRPEIAHQTASIVMRTEFQKCLTCDGS